MDQMEGQSLLWNLWADFELLCQTISVIGPGVHITLTYPSELCWKQVWIDKMSLTSSWLKIGADCTFLVFSIFNAMKVAFNWQELFFCSYLSAACEDEGMHLFLTPVHCTSV